MSPAVHSPMPLIGGVHLLKFLLLLMFRTSSAIASTGNNNDVFPPTQLPSSITLRAAVLHAPPFAIVSEREDDDGTTIEYSGFQYDLIQRLQIFASEMDNVTLNFNLSVAPAQYEDALNLLAAADSSSNDCQNGTSNEECDQHSELDMIIGNFYATPQRSMKVDFSPSWLKSTISTIKYKDKQQSQQDYTTLTEASNYNGKVCLKGGTFYSNVVRAKFPSITFVVCDSYETCIRSLKEERCILYADDELQLHYQASLDNSLEVTPERFNTQWIVWPIRFQLDRISKKLLDRWIYAATINATLDDLYSKYFVKALCPAGTAGETCELPCDPDFGQADATGRCVCVSVRYTGDDCSIEVPEEINAIPTPLKVLSYTMLGINLTVISICAVWLHYCRFSAQVRYCQPFFLLLVLLGCFISSCTIIPMAREDDPNNADDDSNDNHSPSTYSCMAIPWLYSLGFSVTFGTLFAKILRVYLIFTQAEHQKTTGDVGTNTRRYFVTFQETLCVIGVVLVIDVAILVAWTIYEPLTWEREIIRQDQFGDPLESEGYCSGGDHWAYFAGAIATLHFLLLAVACYMCYAARNIPTQFSESKYLSIAMISNLQIFIVGIPILVIIGTEPQTSFFVRSVMIWMNDLAVVCLIFGNLIYSVYMKPPECNRESFVRREINSAVATYRRQNSKSSNSWRKVSSTGEGSSGLTAPLPPGTALPPMEDPSETGSEQPGNPRSDHGESIEDDNVQIQETEQPNLPREKRPRPSFSSLTLGSHTTTSQSRKSVSWGRAYFSECGMDDEVGVPIVDTTPIDMTSPPKEENKKKRFSSTPCQGAPQYKRPTASPESSEEFHVSSTGPVMPERKGSFRMESLIEHMENSYTSYGFTPQPAITEECPEPSDSTNNEVDEMPGSEQFVSALGFSVSSKSCDRHQVQPFESSGKTAGVPALSSLVEPVEQQPPLKPDRRPTDTTISSVTARVSDVSAPQKPNRRPTDTTVASRVMDLSDRRMSDSSKPTSDRDLLQPVPQKTDRPTDTTLPPVNPRLSDASAPQKPNRRLTDTSVDSQAVDLGARRMSDASRSSSEPNLLSNQQMLDRRSSDATISSLNPRTSNSSAPQKPDRRPTDTSVDFPLMDLHDRRMSDTLRSASDPDLRSTLQKPERMIDISMSSAAGVDFPYWSGPLKPGRQMSDLSISSKGLELSESGATPKADWEMSNTSITSRPDLWESSHLAEAVSGQLQKTGNQLEVIQPLSVGEMLVSKAKDTIRAARGNPKRMVLCAGSRHKAETAQGAPKPPGRRNSSSFADLDDSSTEEDMEGEEDTCDDSEHPTADGKSAGLSASLLSSGEITCKISNYVEALAFPSTS